MGLETVYLFNLLIHIKIIEIFPNDTIERIQKWMVLHFDFILPIGFFSIFSVSQDILFL